MRDKLTWPVNPYQGLRGTDGFGNGAFHAPRVASNINAGKQNGEQYEHQGLDIRATPGDMIVAWCDGTLFSPGYAYLNGAGNLRSLHLVGHEPAFERFRFTLLYAKLLPEFIIGGDVKRGQPIAVAQDVAGFKMVGRSTVMINHVHFEARRYNAVEPGGTVGTIELVDPTTLFGGACE